jgi:Txe/YoeB family toxin of Txe-Axe toxin-antitoxin module
MKREPISGLYNEEQHIVYKVKEESLFIDQLRYHYVFD